MSSCEKSILTIQKRTSLQARPEDSPTHHRKMLSFFYFKKVTASMTLEAAFVLPMFLFFIMNILSLFIMYEEYSDNLAKLHQMAKVTALSAHMTSSDEVVKLKQIQSIMPFSDYMGFDGSTAMVSANVRKWTGYNVTNGRGNINEEEYVYITESGTVYHRSRNCSHLNISIRVIPYEDITGERNAGGGKYYMCERCGRFGNSGVVFVTNQGNKYHSNAACSGLKRTILTVRLSEAGGRSACSSCA